MFINGSEAEETAANSRRLLSPCYERIILSHISIVLTGPWSIDNGDHLSWLSSFTLLAYTSLIFLFHSAPLCLCVCACLSGAFAHDGRRYAIGLHVCRSSDLDGNASHCVSAAAAAAVVMAVARGTAFTWWWHWYVSSVHSYRPSDIQTARLIEFRRQRKTVTKIAIAFLLLNSFV